MSEHQQLIEMIKSVSENSTDIMRAHRYQIDMGRIQTIKNIKYFGNVFFDILNTLAPSREVSLSKTKLEEAVMWAVKGISS